MIKFIIMKKLIITILYVIFTINIVYAETNFEIGSSFLTHHYSDLNADRFANKVSQDGRTINNPLYSLSWVWQDKGDSDYSSFTLYSGEDSIGSPMNGFLLTKGLGYTDRTSLQLGFIWGMYFYDENAWREKFYDREAQTPSWLVASYGEQWNGVNMVFGLELNLQVQVSDSVYVRLKNNITPMISNHSFALGFNF